MATATLIIKDEANVKISGLDLVERKDLVNKFKYDIPGAKYMPAVRLGRWDGKAAFCQLSGQTYINLLPEIIPFLIKRGYEIAIDDQREYQTLYDLATVDESTFADKVWPDKHPVAGQPIILRDYQIEIVNRFLENPQSITEAATGSGKTIVTATLSWAVEKYGRSIIIVPNKSLVTQTEADYINLGLDVGVYYGDRKEFGCTHTICTWQSLNILQKNAVVNEDTGEYITINDFINGVVCIMVDECHMVKAAVLKDLLTGPMAKIPIRWGLTGTIPKEDFEKVSLTCSIGSVLGRLSAAELQDQGVLAKCHVNIVQLMDNSTYGDYQSELKYLTTNTARIEYIASLVNKVKETGNTLVLVDRIESGKMLQADLDDLLAGDKNAPDVVFVSGGTKAKEREGHYDNIATSTNQILIATYGVAAVGLNLPRIFNLVLIEPGKSFVRVIQSIGRGLRKAEDKDDVAIWDITSSCKFAKRHLTTRKKYYTAAEYPYTIEKVHWQK